MLKWILSSSTAKISDVIKKKIESLVKDKKECQLLFDLLDCEIEYLDVEKPDFKGDYKDVIEQRFPFREAVE